MFHMCQEVQSLLIFIVPALLYLATPPVSASHAGQAACSSQLCPAGDEIGLLQTSFDGHNISNPKPPNALAVLSPELWNTLVELNGSNINKAFPGFDGIVGHMVEDTLCKKAAVLAKPVITKGENTLTKVTHHVDQFLNGTLEAGRALVESSANSSNDLAAKLENFENYGNRALDLGVQQWRNMYDMFNPMAAAATQALHYHGMHSLVHKLRLDKINKSLNDVLHVYEAAQYSVHGLGHKSVNEVGITLKRLNATMKIGLSGVDAFALALNTSFMELTDGLETSFMSLLPKSCNSIWKQPLASAGLTLTNISLKVQDSMHRLASDLIQAGEQLGIQPMPSEPSFKSGGSRFMVPRPAALSAMAVAAVLAGFHA